jgi:hypothetical protein
LEALARLLADHPDLDIARIGVVVAKGADQSPFIDSVAAVLANLAVASAQQGGGRGATSNWTRTSRRSARRTGSRT